MTEERENELKRLAEDVFLKYTMFMEKLIPPIVEGLTETEKEVFFKYYLAAGGMCMKIGFNDAEEDPDLTPQNAIEAAMYYADEVYGDV